MAQRRRDQHAAGPVHVHVHSKSDQATLQITYPRVKIRKALELLLDQLPVGQRIDEQAAVGVGGNDQMSGAPFEQRIAVSRRHREPALAVQIELRDAAKHGSPFGGKSGSSGAGEPLLPLSTTSTHYISKKAAWSSARQAFSFCPTKTYEGSFQARLGVFMWTINAWKHGVRR